MNYIPRKYKKLNSVAMLAAGRLPFNGQLLVVNYGSYYNHTYVNTEHLHMYNDEDIIAKIDLSINGWKEFYEENNLIQGEELNDPYIEQARYLILEKLIKQYDKYSELAS